MPTLAGIKRAQPNILLSTRCDDNSIHGLLCIRYSFCSNIL